jgi:hypothetical protein
MKLGFMHHDQENIRIYETPLLFCSCFALLSCFTFLESVEVPEGLPCAQRATCILSLFCGRVYTDRPSRWL